MLPRAAAQDELVLPPRSDRVQPGRHRRHLRQLPKELRVVPAEKGPRVRGGDGEGAGAPALPPRPDHCGPHRRAHGRPHVGSDVPLHGVSDGWCGGVPRRRHVLRQDRPGLQGLSISDAQLRGDGGPWFFPQRHPGAGRELSCVVWHLRAILGAAVDGTQPGPVDDCERHTLHLLEHLPVGRDSRAQKETDGRRSGAQCGRRKCSGCAFE
mmetsp:Transcript_19468/g.38699  ORF Transcript_19468/g.38699 Transcript_19468/m.38699 type:complete len:210 (+) Transcript_19468:401-1030(+)